MDKNEKMAFAILATVVVVQGLQARSFRKRVTTWARATYNVVDSMYQGHVNILFDDITSRYDQP